MNLQIIKSVEGKAEYVLLPIRVYHSLQYEIKKELKQEKINTEYVPFDPADYVENPVALVRIETGLTQKELAKRMKVTQAYISKIEKQDNVTPAVLKKVNKALK